LKQFKQIDGVTLRQQPDAASDDSGVDAGCSIIMAVEISQLHIEGARYVRQSADRDAVRPALVFLHLLERQAQLFGQVRLAKAEFPPTEANSPKVKRKVHCTEVDPVARLTSAHSHRRRPLAAGLPA
jgi:hypothetical protein